MSLRRDLELKGAVFQTSMDSEIFLHLIAQSSEQTIKASLLEALERVEGAFSLLVLTKDTIYALRDPYGFRPLCLGKLGEARVVTSETCALDLVGAEVSRSSESG